MSADVQLPEVVRRSRWPRELTLCIIVGFGGGFIGVIVGVFAAPMLGIVEVPGSKTQGAHAPEQLPVKMATRPRKSGPGVVLQLQNASASALQSVVILCEAPGSHTPPKSISLETWPPGGVVEVGEDDGWVFAAGQHVSVQARDYSPISVTLN